MDSVGFGSGLVRDVQVHLSSSLEEKVGSMDWKEMVWGLNLIHGNLADAIQIVRLIVTIVPEDSCRANVRTVNARDVFGKCSRPGYEAHRDSCV